MTDRRHHRSRLRTKQDACPAQPKATAIGRSRDDDTGEIDVTDDLPDRAPVTASEVETIETYLGTSVDQFLADAAAGNIGLGIGRSSRPRR